MLALLAAVAMAQATPNPDGPIFSNPAATAGSGAMFRLLPASSPGASITTADTSGFCSTYAPYISGANSFCLSGDGTSSGTLSLSAVGSPSASTDAICPNGPDCVTVASQRIDGTNSRFETASAAAPTDFSCWFFGIPDSTSGDQRLVDRNDTLLRQASLWINNTTLWWYVWKSGAGATNISSTLAVVSGSPFFAVGTYDYVTDGTSISRLYLNGSQVNSSTTAVGPIQAGSQSWMVGLIHDTTSGAFAGRIISAGCTEQVLDATTIAAMNSSLQATLQGSRGEAVTDTRTTVRGCFNSSAGSILPPNRPCVRSSSLSASGATTNLVTNSQALDSWTATGTPTESPNSAVAPDGTLTADLIGDDDAAAVESESATATATAGSAYTLACWAKAGTLSSLRMSLDGTACQQALTSSWSRYTCTDTSASGASITAIVQAGTSSATDVGNVNLWGCQVNLGASAASYCPTTTAAATCNADAVSATASNLPSSTGSIALSWTPTFATQPATQTLYDTSGGNVEGNKLFIDTLGRINWVAYHSSVSGPILTPCCTITWTAGQTYRIRVDWDGTGLTTVYRDGVSVLTGTTAQVATGTGGTIAAGASGLISDLQVCASTGRCR